MIKSSSSSSSHTVLPVLAVQPLPAATLEAAAGGNPAVVGAILLACVDFAVGVWEGMEQASNGEK